MKVWAKTKEYAEGKFLVVRRDATIPHWPHFVLGARDEAVPATLRFYAEQCAALGYEPDYVHSIYELADDFEQYRKLHGDGDPEAPPHRKDVPDVLKAMRGEPATIHVERDKQNSNKTRPIAARKEGEM
jgi:hypothetical protein